MTDIKNKISVYMSSRERGMLKKICEQTGENQSQCICALVMQEYYKRDHENCSTIVADVPTNEHQIQTKDKPIA